MEEDEQRHDDDQLGLDLEQPASNDSPVLTLQAEHRSNDIENGQVFSILFG